MCAGFIAAAGQGEKTFTLDIKDLRLCTSSTMYHRFLLFKKASRVNTCCLFSACFFSAEFTKE
jgi:hypothetical protein